MRTDPPKHFFFSTGRLRSRWRLCRLTLDSRSRLRRATDVASPLRGDAAYPLRVRRICLRLRAAASGGWLRHASADAVFLMFQTGVPAANQRSVCGGERRRSGGSETWPCGTGRTIRSLRRRHGGRRPLPATGKFPAQWGRRIGAGRRRGWIPASNGTHPAHPAWIMPLAGARSLSLHTGKAPGRKARGSPSYETLSSRGRDCSRSCCCSHSRSHCRPSCRCRSSTR